MTKAPLFHFLNRRGKTQGNILWQSTRTHASAPSLNKSVSSLVLSFQLMEVTAFPLQKPKASLMRWPLLFCLSLEMVERRGSDISFKGNS